MLPDNVSIKHLRALQAIAREGSLTAAAGVLHLTPPAVHTQLKNMENALEVALVDRTHPGGMVLTPPGEVMLTLADRIEARLTLALRDIAALRDGRAGHVALGVVSTGKYFAPSLVARLARLHPDIEISLKVGNREEIVTMLRNETIRLAIMGRPPRDPVTVATPVGDHPHVLIAAPDHPLAALDNVPPKAFLDETFVTREEGSGTRILMNRYLDRIGGGHIFRTVQMDSNETIKQSVMAGLGIAMISEHTVIEELRSGRLVRLRTGGLPIVRQWFLLYPAPATLSPAEIRIRDTIAAMEGSFLPAIADRVSPR